MVAEGGSFGFWLAAAALSEDAVVAHTADGDEHRIVSAAVGDDLDVVGKN